MCNVNVKSGCYGCTDRTIGCHSSCEKYLKYREEIQKYNEAKRLIDSTYTIHKYKGKRKTQRFYHYEK